MPAALSSFELGLPIPFPLAITVMLSMLICNTWLILNSVQEMRARKILQAHEKEISR